MSPWLRYKMYPRASWPGRLPLGTTSPANWLHLDDYEGHRLLAKHTETGKADRQ